MSDNLAIWNKLGKTDPKHTKSFSRAGGFKGTATRPVYLDMKMTEVFGPCGTGWGMGKPEFTLVEAGTEKLVYCTVELWYSIDGTRHGSVWGVGGDKAVAGRQSGTPFTDDEAFKKAYTDAVGNAMKYLGVSADIHMGRFDDNKYVKELKEEFGPEPEARPEPKEVIKEQLTASLAIVPEVTIPEFVAISQRLLDQISSTVSGFEMDKLVRSPEFKADLAKLPKREQERIAGIGKRHRSTFPVDLTAAG